MSTDDVHGDDMDHPELSDEQLAELLDGTATEPVDHPVTDALMAAREQLRSEPAPTPGAVLSEYLGVDQVAPTPTSAADPTIATTVDPVVIDPTSATEPTPRRTPVLASLTAFIGTLTGKVLIGGGVAVASIGGAHAAGVVDIPGLPEVDDSSITETLDDDSDNRGPDDTNDTLPTIVTPSTAAEVSISSTTSTTVAPSTSTTTVPGPVPTVGPPSTTSPTTTTPGSTSSTSTTSTSSTTTTVSPAGPAIAKSYTVNGVGTTTVSVSDGQISLVSAVPAAGWSLDETQQDASGVESRYVQGELETRIDFEIEDGQLRVRVRERNDATDERTERFEYFPL